MQNTEPTADAEGPTGIRQAELAPILGMVPWTLIDLRRRGHLRASRDAAGRVTFDPAEVERAIGAPLADGPFYAVADAAALLELSPAQVYKRIRLGHIAAARLGGRTVRISRAEIERLINERAAIAARRERNAARAAAAINPAPQGSTT